MKKVLLLIVLLIGIVVVLSFFFFNNPATSTSTVLAQMKSENSNFNFGSPQNVSEPTPDGNLKGVKISGTMTSAQATLPHFENAKLLESYGYKPDMSLSADGPGSSVWGYKQTTGGKSSIILFSYNTKPTSSNPNEPLQFNCPCQMNVSVFVSEPYVAANSADESVSSQQGLANPASVNCSKVGGTDVIEALANGAQYGLCQFEDNMACEEWALYRGQCPVGGVKTTGYDTMGQKYCAWLGGKTFAVPNSQCTLPSGKVCSTEALYNGTCSNN